jgi:hypothetical protein
LAAGNSLKNLKHPHPLNRKNIKKNMWLIFINGAPAANN